MKILMVTNKVKTYALGFQNVLEPLGQLGHVLEQLELVQR
mgnify:CR=1 FL=1